MEDLDDDILISTIGAIGPAHWFIYFSTALTIILHSWQMVSNKFLTYKVDYFCKRPVSMKHISLETWLNISAPLQDDGQFDHCKMFDLDYSDIKERPEKSDNLPTVECQAFEYNEKLFQNTATARFDLVCSRKSYGRLAQTIFFTGTLFGVFASGPLSDRFGRIKSYFFWLFLWTSAGFIEAFVTDFWIWSALRFVVGGASIAYNTVQTVYLIEMSGRKYRSITNNYFRAAPFGIGIITLGGMLFFVTDMITLELIMSLSGVPFLVLLVFLPESPRWCLINGLTDKGLKSVELFCKYNKRPFGKIEQGNILRWASEHSVSQQNQNRESANLFRLIHYKHSLMNLLNISFCWMALSMAYFGLVYNTPPFGLDVRIVFILPVVIAIGFIGVFPYMENTFGRKTMLFICLLLTGAVLLSTLLVPKDYFAYNWPIIGLLYLGQIFCGGSFDFAYSYTRELFPTSLRSTTMGFASGAARVGSMLSAIIATLEVYNVLIPVLVYGGISFVACFLCMFIHPETKNMNLPDSLEEAEKAASTKNPWINWGSKSKEQQPKVDKSEENFAYQRDASETTQF